MAYLVDLLEQAPKTAGLSAEDAAAVICASWFGLLVVSYMYKPMNPPRVRTLFRRILLHTAGIEDQNRPAETPPATPVVAKKRSDRKRSRTTSKELEESGAISLVNSSAERAE
jgi:hypothetical protein